MRKGGDIKEGKRYTMNKGEENIKEGERYTLNKEEGNKEEEGYK